MAASWPSPRPCEPTSRSSSCSVLTDPFRPERSHSGTGSHPSATGRLTRWQRYFLAIVVSVALLGFAVVAGATVAAAIVVVAALDAIVVSVALLGFAVVAGAEVAATLFWAALDAIVVSVAADLFLVGVDLILIRVQVRSPFTVLQTSLVLAFVVTADAGLDPNDTARRSAVTAVVVRTERRLAFIGATYDEDDATSPLSPQASHSSSQENSVSFTA